MAACSRDDGFVTGQAVLLEGERITAIVPANDAALPHGAADTISAGRCCCPDSSTRRSTAAAACCSTPIPMSRPSATIGQAHRRFGTTGFLPTLISDDLNVVAKALAAVQASLAAGVPGVLGIHIEGPFLNVMRKGVHDSAKFRGLDESAIGLLTSLQGGRTLVTLAPEMTTTGDDREARGGGCDRIGRTYQCRLRSDTRCACGTGCKGFTHLFNAMSQLEAREPGVVGAALEDQDSWCGIIVDGRHVDPAVLRIALRCKRNDRFMLVTDAMPSVGTSEKSFLLQGRRISVEGNACVDEDGTLAGSHMDMAGAVRNAVSMLGLTLPEAVRMASRYPAEFLGIGQDVGRIAAGYSANLVLADDALNVLKTWIDGRS